MLVHGPMDTKDYRGLTVLTCPPPEIHITVTSRLKESNANFGSAAKIFKHMPLALQSRWIAAGRSQGTASEQEKRDTVHTVGGVIDRSRGVIMDGISYFQKCFSFRKIAHFSDEYDSALVPPSISSVPSPALRNCFYDSKLEGMALDIEEPILPSYDQLIKQLEDGKEHILRIMKEYGGVYTIQQMDGLRAQLARQEEIIKEARQKKSHTEPGYDEQCVIIESAFSHVISSAGIITWRLPLPFENPLTNPDGSVVLGGWGKPITRLVFTHLPTSMRKPFPSGYVRVAELSDARVRFAGETIVALSKMEGAVASAESNVEVDKTPTNTSPAAEDVYRRLQGIKKEASAKRRLSKVVFTKLPQELDNQPTPPPIVIRKK